MWLGGSFGESNELNGCLLGLAEHLRFVLGLEQRHDMLGRLADLGLRPFGEVQHVAFVLIIG